MLYAPNGKNLALPIVMQPPLSGRFVGRIQYAPTRDDKKRKMNNKKARYLANLAGIPDALIFFSFPFLVSRQEKDVGVRGQRPLYLCYMRRTVKIWPFPSSCTRPCRVVCGAYAIRPYPGQQKTKNKQQKSRVRAGRIQLRTRHFLCSVWGDTLSRYRMLAIEIISANTPAAVTSAPAP